VATGTPWPGQKKDHLSVAFSSCNGELLGGQSFVASIPQMATRIAAVMANSIIAASSTVLSLIQQSGQWLLRDRI